MHHFLPDACLSPCMAAVFEPQLFLRRRWARALRTGRHRTSVVIRGDAF